MKKLILINAVIWATVLLLSAYFFGTSEHYKFFFLVLIVFATITNGLMSKLKNEEKSSNC